jgi:hypothetical protein
MKLHKNAGTAFRQKIGGLPGIIKKNSNFIKKMKKS